MIEMSQVAGLACVFMRMTGCIIFNPIFGRRNFPIQFQVGMTLMFSILIVLSSDVRVTAGGTLVEYFVMLLVELLVGFTIGIVVSLFTYVVILGGEFIDLQMGLSMSKMFDPTSGVQMSVTASYFNFLFMFMFFAMDGHLTLVNLFLNSAELVPYGAANFLSPELPQAILDTFCQCTILGLKLAMPIVGIQFLLEMGVGILMKTIPQINVFVVNLQVKIMVGLVMLLAVFSPLASFIEDTINGLFHTIGAVMELM